MDILIGVSVIGFALTLVMLYGIGIAADRIADTVLAVGKSVPFPLVGLHDDLKAIEKRLEWFQLSLETGDGRRALGFDSREIERLLKQILDCVSH